ncbi:ABC transporter permease [Paenibacillus sp. T3-5-0-4]|nr:methionine ABC transporter permease [Paenibacillus endoradicis]MCR8658561.1 ABC transporter permease [Paenibacillus endoradicis]
MISYFDNVRWDEVYKATKQTLFMLGFSLPYIIAIGFVMGILLFLTSSKQMLENKVVYVIISFVVNVMRSVPFVILIIVLLPLTKIIAGTSIGVKGAIPPLVIAAAPFFARLVESALREVDHGIVEAAQAMGATKWQIVWRVMLRESRAGLITAITITMVTLVSYTAMAGIVGGGGLGDLAIRYGHHRYRIDMLIVNVVLIVVLVQLMQMFGDRLVRYFSKKQL